MKTWLRKAAAVAASAVMALTGTCVTGFADNSGFTREQAQVAFNATVAKPTYSIKGSSGVRKVKLTCSTSGATIYYTRDGSVPTTSSYKYTSGTVIVLKAKTKLRAIAVKGSSKSAIMSKTISISSMIGDVTGDGAINKNDYNRLGNYIKGTTSYICTDNSDVNGDGKINNTDLNLIKQYLNGSIDEFPIDDPVPAITLKTPSVTVYKTMGGKRIELSTSDSGTTLYYTTNGTTPTTSSTRYTNSFMIYSDTTVKVIAAKSGAVSNVKSRAVEVDKCANVTASGANTSQKYTDPITIALSCTTPSSSIYYTTDNSNPLTSSTAKLFTGSIRLEKTTTIKAASQAKGYADSEVQTFSYTVDYNPGLTISGTVWDDTPTATSTPDGLRSTTENGINGISVMLYNTKTKTNYDTYTTRTLNGISGSFQFTNVPAGSYQVMFLYNYMQYRPYTAIMNGGNQALATVAVQDMYVSNDGVYSVSSNSRLLTMTSYSYASAIANTYFNTSAATSAVYTTDAANVGLALVSNAYGAVDVSVATNAFAGNQVKNGDIVQYTVTVKNSAPRQTLKDATMLLFIDSDLTKVTSGTTGIALPTPTSGTSYNSYYVSLNNILGTNGLAPGASVQFIIKGEVSGTKNSQIYSGFQISRYRYDNSNFDKFSIPGNAAYANMILSTYKKENDEAVSSTLIISDDSSSSATAKKLVWTSDATQAATLVYDGDSVSFTIDVTNGTAGTGEILVSGGNANITATLGAVQLIDSTGKATGSRITVTVTGRGVNQDFTTLTISLKDDVKQAFTKSISYVPTLVTA